MATEDKKILHINAALAAISNGQLAVELVSDPDLGFKTWGGKDFDGAVVQFLAKDKAAKILSLKITDLAGVAAGLVRHSTTGVVLGGLITVAALNALLSDGPLAKLTDVALQQAWAGGNETVIPEATLTSPVKVQTTIVAQAGVILLHRVESIEGTVTSFSQLSAQKV